MGEAWATVSRSYSQAPEPYLLYWRGILAQCLGQTERAIQDLRSFHDRNATDPDLRSLATDARRRLRTLGVNLKKPPAQPRTAGAALAPTGLGIATGIGWGGYYLDTLTLGMFAVRSRLSAYVLPWLSVDVPITFRAVPLIEVDGNDDEVRVVRTLPAFGLGATIRPPEGPVRPFAGIDLAFLLYAQAVVAQSDGSTATRPLFGPVLTARGGVEFHFADFLGVYVSAAGGFAYADRIQETVNALWATTTGIITLDSGVWFRLPMP